MGKQPKKKADSGPVNNSGAERRSGKARKKYPKVFDAVKRRLVTDKG